MRIESKPIELRAHSDKYFRFFLFVAFSVSKEEISTKSNLNFK